MEEIAIKKTKAMYFEELRELVLATIEDQNHQDELIEFIDKQVDALKKRKEAAIRRAEKKKATFDDITNAILEQMSDELITIDEIVVNLNSEEVTRNKVVARVGKLTKAGIITKELVKVGKHKRLAYRLIQTDEKE